MEKKQKIKIWYLIIFNIFFSFSGSFVALQLGLGKIAENIVESITSILFIVFLLYLMPDIKKFVLGLDVNKLYEKIIIGFFMGLVFWYTMVLFIPLNQLLLSNCNIEVCQVALQKYYTFNNSGSFSDLSVMIIATMVIKFVIIGPVREEILYRTAMMTVLYNRYSILLVSIIIAIIFSVFHLRYFIFMMSFSLAMSALILKYRSILPGVIAHGTYNLTIYFLYPSKEIIGHYTNLGVYEIMVAVLLLGNIYYWSIYVIKQNERDSRNDDKLLRKTKC